MPTTKIQTVPNKNGSVCYKTTVPLEYTKLLSWKKGTVLLWEKQGKTVVIREMPSQEIES